MRVDVLVLPHRVVPRLADLRADEVSDLFLTVQTVGKVIEKAYQANALTISLQDGAAAGQSVPHVHIHILPRMVQQDFGEDKDEVYPALEQNEFELKQALGAPKSPTIPDGGDTSGARLADDQIRKRAVGEKWLVQNDSERRARSLEEMGMEAKWLGKLFLNQGEHTKGD